MELTHKWRVQEYGLPALNERCHLRIKKVTNYWMNEDINHPFFFFWKVLVSSTQIHRINYYANETKKQLKLKCTFSEWAFTWLKDQVKQN